MTNEEIVLTMTIGAIAQMPKDDQDKVHACAEKLRHDIKEAGDHGIMALALVGAEMQKGCE